MHTEPITVATESDSFADIPALQPGLRQERATWALSLSPEDFADFAACEADDLEEYLEDQLFWARGEW